MVVRTFLNNWCIEEMDITRWQLSDSTEVQRNVLTQRNVHSSEYNKSYVTI